MPKKLTLALALTVAIVAILAAPVERGAARTGLYVSTSCYSAGHQRVECYGYASGGSGAYYYDWTPNPLYGGEGQGYVLIPCARAYSNQTVYLTVTDLNTGATGSASETQWCGDAD
jgi:hypothetical protein